MPPRPRVLVIEDDAALRKVLELRLTIEGFEVAVACDGQAGLDTIDDFVPDAVISDLMMPRLDGYGFCRAARARPGLEHLPILLLSAHQRDGEVDEILRLGSIEYMTKPFDAATLAGTLRRLTGAAGGG
ncbi:MAG: response regulator [Chloroflexi bacterium]|nr:MAG: response regulator [Chloroflexota bacterium]